MCRETTRFVAAARFMAESPGKRPQARRRPPSPPPPQRHWLRRPGRPRSGKGRATPRPGRQEPAPTQARDWFRADLGLCSKILDNGNAKDRDIVVEALHHWKRCGDLYGIRDARALARLPEAEQKEWQSLWNKVDSLLKLDQSSTATAAKESATVVPTSGSAGVGSAETLRIGDKPPAKERNKKPTVPEIENKRKAEDENQRKKKLALAEIDNARKVETDILASIAPAATQAWFGQATEYTATCDRVLRIAKDTQCPADSRACGQDLQLASVRRQDPDAALVLAQSAVELGKGHGMLVYFRMALGMAEFRKGHYAAADAALLAASRAAANNYHVSGTSAFYRAMSLFKQGKETEAHKLVTEAVYQNEAASRRREKSPGRRQRRCRRSHPLDGLQGSPSVVKVDT